MADIVYPSPYGRLLDVLADAVAEIENFMPPEVAPEMVASWKAVDGRITEQTERLRKAAVTLRESCALAIPAGRSVESGGVTWKRTGKPARSGWRKEELAIAVRDTVRWNRTDDVVVLPDGTEVLPGEIIPESEMEKLLDVFPLGTPRTMVMEARGLQVDEWCTTTWGARDVKVAE